MDSHKTGAQFLDGFAQQIGCLNQIRLDLGKMLATLIGQAG
jgi:hypothetical protein